MIVIQSIKIEFSYDGILLTFNFSMKRNLSFDIVMVTPHSLLYCKQDSIYQNNTILSKTNLNDDYSWWMFDCQWSAAAEHVWWSVISVCWWTLWTQTLLSCSQLSLTLAASLSQLSAVMTAAVRLLDKIFEQFVQWKRRVIISVNYIFHFITSIQDQYYL